MARYTGNTAFTDYNSRTLRCTLHTASLTAIVEPGMTPTMRRPLPCDAELEAVVSRPPWALNTSLVGMRTQEAARLGDGASQLQCVPSVYPSSVCSSWSVTCSVIGRSEGREDYVEQWGCHFTVLTQLGYMKINA